jgi:copper chaperone CopZ
MSISVQTFEVEGAGCSSCAARVTDALAPLTTVHAVEVDESTDTATVRAAADSDFSEEAVQRALDGASEGSGHSYRLKTGSWRLEASTE